MTDTIRKITFLYRKPNPHQYSIEDYFCRVQDDLRRLGVATHKITATKHSQGLTRRLRILLQIAWRRFDLLHVTGDITFAALVSRGPVVVTIHDIQVLSRLTGIRRAFVKYLWFEWPIRRADLVTVNSEETARRLRDQIAAARRKELEVVPVSVADEFVPSPRLFEKKKPVILQVGTKDNKNVPRLLEALGEIPCILRIIGPLSARLCRKLESYGIDYENLCDLTKDEMVQAYQESDLLAFVSTEEGFGMPILEAQRVGRPVVTSLASSMPEVAGDSACFVDPFDVESIRVGLRRVINNKSYRRQLVMSGFENAARFDRKEIARRYLELYDRLYSTQLQRVKVPAAKSDEVESRQSHQ